MGSLTADWATLSSDFAPDGSLRDIYIHNTTVDDHQAMIDAIRRDGLATQFLVNGDLASMPERVADVFALREYASVLLQILVGSVRIHLHFFVDWEIECDIDPREISGQEQLDIVISFMRLLSEAVKKEVVLTHEKAPNAVILRYPAD